jgi:hypothetical protein
MVPSAVRLVLMLAVVLPALLVHPYLSDAKSPPPVLNGADLPHAVTLAFADWQAFYDATPRPERLPFRPKGAEGTVYTLAQWYWAGSHAWAEEIGAGEDAHYYPFGGYLAVAGEGETAWFRLDELRRTLLDRYIRLTRAGSLASEPGVLQVLGAAAADEGLVVEVGRLSESVAAPPAVASAFWQAVGGARKVSVIRMRVDRGFDVRVRLPEGRTLEFWYNRADALLVDAAGYRAGWLQLEGYALDHDSVRALEEAATAAGMLYPDGDDGPALDAAAAGDEERGLGDGVTLLGTAAVLLALGGGWLGVRRLRRRMDAGQAE